LKTELVQFSDVDYIWTKKPNFATFLVTLFMIAACGNSTSKKDSQSNAAKDFVSYLVRQGVMSPSEVPAEAGISSETVHSAGLGLAQQRVFQVH
jgi:hypothetical protein